MPDRFPPEDPREWLNRARSNLALAKNTCDNSVYFEDLCFNAQQAAEKAIKAVCIFHQGCRHPHECGRIHTVIFFIQILNGYQDAETSFAGSCRMTAQGSSPLQSKN